MSGELVTTPDTTLFRADAPADVLAEARSVAMALKPALLEGGMVQQIGQSEHVKIEGWQTLGSMLRVTPHIVWTRKLAEPFDGWEARAEIRTLDGRAIGAAEAMCERSEPNWRRSPEYAVRSMAQTRAQSKAFAGPLRFIITLAGYAGTPAEEAGGTNELEYGPAMNHVEAQGLDRALDALYHDREAATTLTTRLAEDAGGYIPSRVARALMLTAAHRPDPRKEAEQETGTGADEPPTNDTP